MNLKDQLNTYKSNNDIFIHKLDSALAKIDEYQHRNNLLQRDFENS